MTYRDGLTRFSARSVRRGDSGHREAWAIPMGHDHRSLVLLGKFFTCPGWQGMHALLQPSLKKDTR